MSDIYYDDHMVGIFGMVANYCYHTGYDKDWVNNFWNGLQEQPGLYNEFINFLNTGELAGNYILHGYSVLETFVWNIKHYNMLHDIGKDGTNNNKNKMILSAFKTMMDLYHEPQKWIEILSHDSGMDRI